ncbi:MAG: NTPase [Nostoc sp. NMS7]|uniref:P-loop NTPase fold protein n=1 Tax=Nostoc sp. NMS7 TaxID=2815391 RepID=UPI0025DE20B0|nr:P-loop NTPase fold protein [Nostoc sp. NMS7]MBN3950585.1 NTPase [Nostoc sp. NMS7]
MTQDNQPINGHIDEYLNYYCGLSHPPGFAVLLKGKWGSGKTWFINRYFGNLKQQNRKCLYVSLYGMTSFSEIEEAFLQQQIPFLASKPVAIVRNIATQVLKSNLKIDLNDDNTLNLATPSIKLSELFANLDQSTLIFDDLERCNIDLSNILGYINNFVEHKGLKVIIVADEEKLEKNDSYKAIKEKLINQDLAIEPDFHGALEKFITNVSKPDIRKFLSENIHLIQNVYIKAEYENLRTLKQIILDFERIFESLPEKAHKSKEEILKDSKLYIDYLKDRDQSKLASYSFSTGDNILGGYLGLSFQGAKLEDFKDFCTYLEKSQESAKNNNMPNIGQELLTVMQSDVWKFQDMICLSASPYQVGVSQRYHRIPVLKHIKETDFVEKLLSLEFEDKHNVCRSLIKRYEVESFNKELFEELDWLKSVRSLLLEEIARKQGKISGYTLTLHIEPSLNEAINKLEGKID